MPNPTQHRSGHGPRRERLAVLRRDDPLDQRIDRRIADTGDIKLPGAFAAAQVK
jgi:hypothetical protein